MERGVANVACLQPPHIPSSRMTKISVGLNNIVLLGYNDTLFIIHNRSRNRHGPTIAPLRDFRDYPSNEGEIDGVSAHWGRDTSRSRTCTRFDARPCQETSHSRDCTTVHT